jgi:tRNA U55 pseudouridine synthase TruB
MVTFIRLLCVQDALKLEVMQHCSGLVKAQVGAATYAKKLCLTDDANKHCDLIVDPTFWNGLEHIVGDLELICYGTNINQKDST